jgi:hypothetical protein
VLLVLSHLLLREDAVKESLKLAGLLWKQEVIAL